MKKTLLLVFVLILAMSSVLFAQEPVLPIDMEVTEDDAWAGDGGSVYSLESAMFSPDNVGKIVGGTDTWNSRVNLVLETYIDMTTANKTFTFEFYTTEAVPMTGLFQIGNEAAGGYVIEMQFTTDGAIGWETITLDFNGATNGWPNAGEPVVFGQYAQVSIFTNFGDAGTSTYYFDDIAGAANGAVIPTNPEPTDAPPVPTHAEEDVIPVYTEVYTDLAGTNFNPGWGQATTVTVDYVAAGNNTIKYENLNYQGTQYTNQDVSLFEYLHVDFWTNNSTSLDFYLISPGAETNYTLPITPDTWVSVDIPLTDYVPPVNLADVFQFKVVGDGAVFFDNWFFWKNPTAAGTDATLSDLQVDDVTIPGFSSAIFSYDYEVSSGDPVPTVTADPTARLATHVVNDAPSVPGTTTVVVTAQDGVTELTYSVNFYTTPDEGAPTPIHDETLNNVISVYSDSYTDISGVNLNPPWGQATQVSEVDLDGNTTLLYENLNYQGTDWSGNPQDVSGAEYLHVDFWTSTSTDLGFFLISPGRVETEVLLIPAGTLGEWNSVDIPLTSFTGVDLTNVIQFKADGNGDIYFDNYYFWATEGAPNNDATLSDLLIDGTTVTGFDSGTYSYDVELPEGTTLVPTVTATPTDGNASHVVNDAASIPGTTEVVVTAENGTTELTYSVNFSIEGVAPVSDYCETEVWHFNNPAETASAIYLTVTNLDALSMFVEIESADTDPVDLLIVTGGSGATISAEDTSVPGRISRTLTWASNPPADVVMNFLWSKVSFGGNWMLSSGDLTIPFDAECETGGLSSDAKLSDLLVDGTTVDGFSLNTYSYDVELPLGTITVPTVTAVTHDVNASHVINDAASLPGTTEVVVTAEDGTTELTYSVNFTVAQPSAYPTHTVDFEDARVGEDWTWIAAEQAPGFTIISNPVSGGLNTSAAVVEFVAHTTDNNWALCHTTGDGEFTFDSQNSEVKIMVYKPTVSNVGVKFEGASGGHEINIPNTLMNEWEELTFDFSGQIGNSYNKIVIIPDNIAWVNNGFDRPVDVTLYFDNVQVPDGFIAPPPPEPTTGAPAPMHDSGNVLSIYSDVYTDLVGTDFNPNWGQSTVQTFDIVDGDNVIKYESLNYQGTAFTNSDVSGYEYLHVDFWTPDAASLDFYLISTGNEINYSLSITAETWVSVDIPLSEFVPPVDLTDVFQFKVVGNGSVWFDNWYFWVDSVTPAAPENAAVSHNGTSVTVTWDAVSGATSYKVYSCDTPYGTFAEDTSGSFDGTSWTAVAAEAMKYYKVTAEN